MKIIEYQKVLLGHYYSKIGILRIILDNTDLELLAVDILPPAPLALSHTVSLRWGWVSANMEAVTAEVIPPPTSNTLAQLILCLLV